MNIEIVTTSSHAGYQCYGRRFVEGYLLHIPSRPLSYYHESFPGIDQIGPNLTWRNLDHDADRQRFIAENIANPERVGSNLDPNSQSIRFCHKVFAVTDAAFKSKADWLVWVDADVEWRATPDWESVLPAGASLAFLGRAGLYTECGFVGYRVSDGRVLRMLEDMRRYYTTGEIFTRPKTDWHDSKCFDICRLRSGVPMERQHNLSPVHGTHVWPTSPLAKFSVHHKGPGRKRGAYGFWVS